MKPLPHWILPIALALSPLHHAAAAAGDPAARKLDAGALRLAAQVRGKGTPTVVIEAGMGEGPTQSGSWHRVVDGLASTTTVFLYDRAGLGGSDPIPGTEPRTSRDTVRELHRLLQAAKAPAPYILVGHSIGGLHVRMFASEYPGEVAGVVLVDSTHPDQEKEWLAALPKQVPGEPESVTRAREFLSARVANRGPNPERLDYPATATQVRATKPLGDTPLVVLTHSPRWKMVPDLPDDVLSRLEDVNQRLQKTLTRLSSRSSQRIAASAGHALPQEDPQLVIDAVLEVVGQRPGRHP